MSTTQGRPGRLTRMRRSLGGLRGYVHGGKYFVIGVWLLGFVAVTSMAVDRDNETGTGTCYNGVPDSLGVAGTGSGQSSGDAQPTQFRTQVVGGSLSNAAGEGADDAEPPTAVPGGYTLEPVSDQPATLAFGRSRRVGYAQAKFTLGSVTSEADPENASDGVAPEGSDQSTEGASGEPGGDTAASPTEQIDDRQGRVYLPVSIGPFVREDGAMLGGGDPVSFLSELDDTSEERPFMEAMAWSRHGVVTVELCVDRTDGETIGDPGRYIGSIAVVDPRVARTEVPFVVTMSHVNPFQLLSLMFIVVAVAAMYIWLLRTYRPNTDTIDLGEFVDWLGTRTGVLAIGSGAVAAYVAFSATYLADHTWGGSITQLGALVGAGFTAFITAASTVISASSTASGPEMPDLAGETRQEARRQLEHLGFVVLVYTETHRRIGEGHVIRTVPKAGRRTTPSSPVKLIVSSGPGAKE